MRARCELLFFGVEFDEPCWFIHALPDDVRPDNHCVPAVRITIHNFIWRSAVAFDGFDCVAVLRFTHMALRDPFGYVVTLVIAHA